MSYRRPRRPPLSKPVKVGEEREVTIEEVSRRGGRNSQDPEFCDFHSGNQNRRQSENQSDRVASRFAIAEKV